MPYDQFIIDEFNKNGIDKVVELINEFTEKVLEKLEPSTVENNVFDYYKIKYTKQDIEGLNFVKNGLWDLNFQNCFLIDGEIYAYDQEWIENNLPIEFIIYKGILIFNNLKDKINIDELYKKLNILQYKDLFNKLEKEIENKIFEKPIVQAHHKPMKNVKGMYIKNIQLEDENIRVKEELEKEKKKNETSDKKIQEMQDTINIQLAKIDFIENSRGWKVITKIRKIFSYFKFWRKDK